MTIQWNKVTWYSKIVAVVLFVLTFYVGFILGKQAGEVDVNSVPVVNNTSTNTAIPQGPLVGCYVAHLAKDVYALDIQSDTNGAVKGTLAFNNAEKDSSSGTFTGTYTDADATLLGDYTFNSEGVQSVRQVIFKKEGNTFVEGFGATTVVGNRESFTAPINVTFDTSAVFMPSSGCSAS